MNPLSLLVFVSFVALSLSQDLPSADRNGAISRGGRVVGGSKAVLFQFPYQASIQMFDKAGVSYLCGGAIISPVLTAASCVQGYKKFVVSIGTMYLTPIIWSATVTNPANWLVHSEYVAATNLNDIALISPGTMPMNGLTVAAIALPSRSDDLVDLTAKVATVSGYGFTANGGPVSNCLMYTTLSIINNAVCAQTYNFVNSNYICTAGANRGICNGDGGTPLTATIGNTNKLVGISTFIHSTGCASGYPNGYTRVSKYLTWINAHTGIVIAP